MKKMLIVASNIIILASLTGVANAETTPTEKQQAATSEKVEQQSATSEKVESAKKQDTSVQIGTKTDEVQGRGLPKAFSGSEEGQ